MLISAAMLVLGLGLFSLVVVGYLDLKYEDNSVSTKIAGVVVFLAGWLSLYTSWFNQH